MTVRVTLRWSSRDFIQSLKLKPEDEKNSKPKKWVLMSAAAPRGTTGSVRDSAALVTPPCFAQTWFWREKVKLGGEKKNRNKP